MAYAPQNVQGRRENLNDVGSPIFYTRDICNQFFALGWTINIFSHVMECARCRDYSVCYQVH